MQKEIIYSLEHAYLAAKHPNQYVVCVKIDTTNTQILGEIRNILYDIGFNIIETADTMNNGFVFLVCADEAEAYDLFYRFDMENAPYVYIWGPIELLKTDDTMDNETLDAIAYENNVRKGIIILQPNGTVLTDNR